MYFGSLVSPCLPCCYRICYHIPSPHLCVRIYILLFPPLPSDHVDHSHHDVQDEPSFNDAEFFLPEEKYEEEDADLLDSDDDVDNVIQGSL